MHDTDTIVAISTAVGPGGIGIVRLSGPDATRIVSGFFVQKGSGRPWAESSHEVRYGHIGDPATREVIDQALVTLMRAPRSYTREDVVEVGCHGGPVPLRRVLSLATRGGARIAEPGEFTKRAFLNGRIDLAQAEAVCDMIQARTEASGRLAAQQLEGRLSRKVSLIRDNLMTLLATIEAGIDFPEHDVEEITRESLETGLRGALSGVRELLSTAGSGRMFRDGVRVAIVGKPNVGKSSLLNAILGQDRAIVTSIPGTTRDVIEESASIRGVPFVLTDTAGMRETADVVEKIGVERAREALSESNLTIPVFDGTMSLTEDDYELIAAASRRQSIFVLNKADQGILPENALTITREVPDATVAEISALTGQGIETLLDLMFAVVTGGKGIAYESTVVTNARHEACLVTAEKSIGNALFALESQVPYDLTSIDIRAALDSLGLITGETASEDVIDAIFTRFCIGK